MTKLLPKTDPVLSVVILNYNTGLYLAKCLESIILSDLDPKLYEVIIVDNASTDQSFIFAKNQYGKSKVNIKFLPLTTNLGFAAGNNQGVRISHSTSKFLLFLNPDTTVETDTFSKMLSFFDRTLDAAAATCNIILVKTGQTQPECHRSFPTPLTALLHFSGISSKKYFLQDLDYSKTQVVPACVGAFLMVRRSAGEIIGWWNEKYFFYGEDLDFGFKLRQHGLKLYYYPGTKIYHYQGISSGIIKHSQKITQADTQTKIKITRESTRAMRIFYQENLFNHYPLIVQKLVLLGIKLLEIYRVNKAKRNNNKLEI